MIKTAVFSVIFPENLIFFSDFIESINNQTIKSFELLLMNDGVDFQELQSYLSRLTVKCSVFNVDKLSIINIRMHGFCKLIENGYDNVIFADTDDLLYFNRVEKSIESLYKADIVFNDLCVVDKNKQILSGDFWHFRLINIVVDRTFLIDKNILGLGNTAIKVRLLMDFDYYACDEVLAFDWFLFWNILKQKKAMFIADTYTLYRQHDNNCVGTKEITINKLDFILKVKELHYANLVDKFPVLVYNLIDVKMKKRHLMLCDELIFDENISNMNFFWWEETNYLKI